MFHLACDDQGPTLTVVRTREGCLLGGFRGVPFGCPAAGAWVNDCRAFLFSVDLGETCSRVHEVGNAALDHALYGPTWGVGHDLQLASRCL